MTLANVPPDRRGQFTVAQAARLVGCALDSAPGIYLLSLSPVSRRTQVSALKHAAAAFGVQPRDVAWNTIDHAQMAALRAWVADRYAPTTANRILTAVRSVMMVEVRRARMTLDAYTLATSVRPVKGGRLPKGRHVGAGELEQLFKWCAGAGLRGTVVATIMAILYGTGLRRAELVGLNLTDYNSSERTLRVLGKGNIERLQPVPPDAARQIEIWLHIRGSEPGPLICNVRRNTFELMRGDPLTHQRIWNIVIAAARDAGIARLTPHDLRRTFVGDLLDNGVDIVTVQALAGHAHLATTARYDRRGARVRQQAVNALKIPGLAA
jgi:site-specific recombinase XerD